MGLAVVVLVVILGLVVLAALKVKAVQPEQEVVELAVELMGTALVVAEAVLGFSGKEPTEQLVADGIKVI